MGFLDIFMYLYGVMGYHQLKMIVYDMAVIGFEYIDYGWFPESDYSETRQSQSC